MIMIMIITSAGLTADSRRHAMIRISGYRAQADNTRLPHIIDLRALVTVRISCRSSELCELTSKRLGHLAATKPFLLLLSPPFCL